MDCGFTKICRSLSRWRAGRSKKFQEFVIVVDTSYSTSGELIHNFLERDLYDPDRTEQFFAKSRIRIIQCDNQVRMDEEVKNQPRTRTAFKSFYSYRRRRNRFQTGFCLCERIIRAGRVEKVLAGCYILRMARAFIRRNGRNIRPHFCFWMIMMRVPFHRGQ